MSKKNGKTARSAEAQKPNEEAKPLEAAGAPSAEAVAQRSPDSYEILDKLLGGIPEDKLKIAEAAGIPVKPLLVWAATITQEMKAIKETLPNTVKMKMAEAIQEAQQRQTTTQQPQPQALGGGFSLSDVMRIVGGAGGGEIDPTMKYLADIGRETIGLGHHVFKEVIKKAIPDAVESWEKSKRETEQAK